MSAILAQTVLLLRDFPTCLMFTVYSEAIKKYDIIFVYVSSYCKVCIVQADHMCNMR